MDLYKVMCSAFKIALYFNPEIFWFGFALNPMNLQ